ncbi:hypothetical protein BDA99DRAFT_430816 [Phascolomyces articulosus]|uniref:Uncharacterized protein n=1 Tax=Phascolomyces articulosus TaxID=60185 RepID=A0AAD5PI89_9FUNG|nr:hypothetical protein BDA99DRAFT_430816 [Phascolomyces articulosus]
MLILYCFISVTVNYTSFCDKACSNETYAWGAPSRLLQIPAREGIDPDYSHPQILVKQFFAEWKGKWAEHDVDIQINHDAYINAVDFDLAEQSGWNGTGVPPGGKFWFKDEGPIRDYQIDMTYVILHELLHGVGIISSWGAYFTGNSPLRALVDDFFDDEDFWFASPSPYSEVLYGTGPVFVTHFQRNTIFDKYLNVEFTDINRTEFINLKTLSEQMRDFCVQDNEAFIVRFIDNFINSDTISNQANTLYRALTIPNTISFDFKTDDKSTVFNNNEYLNRTYYNMTLLTGDSVVKGSSEHSGRINNRPGLRISHLSDSYADKPDFIMTQTFKTGATLQQLVNIAYNNTPLVIYTAETTNGTLVNQTYRSPIGPGILRALDTIGYSTVLKRTDYTKLEPENKDDDNKDKSCELNRHYPRRYGKRSDAISLLLSPNNWDIICIIIVVIITTTTITPITLLTS